jgi:hypothetical protein
MLAFLLSFFPMGRGGNFIWRYHPRLRRMRGPARKGFLIRNATALPAGMSQLCLCAQTAECLNVCSSQERGSGSDEVCRSGICF